MASSGTLPQLFAEQVERASDDVAIVTEDLTVTFRELDERSSRLARLLVSRGWVPRSPWRCCWTGRSSSWSPCWRW